MPSREEILLKKVGNFGKFQKITVAAVALSSVFSASTLVMLNVFILYTPPHRCYLPNVDGNPNFTHLHENLPPLPNEVAPNASSDDTLLLSRYIPLETKSDGTQGWSRCYRYQEPLLGDESNQTVVPCDHQWKFFNEPDHLSAITEFNLVCDDAWLSPLASTFHMCGFLFGSFIGGFISDKFGRRRSILINWSTLVGNSLAVTLLPLWKVMYFFWFFMGISVLGRVTTGMVIVKEVTPTKYRHAACVFNTLACATCFMLLPLLNYLLPNWRHFMAVYTGIQAVIFLVLFGFVKESLYWLLQNLKTDEALKLLKKIGKCNNKRLRDEDESFVHENILETKEISEKEVKNVKMSVIDLIKISFLRRRFFIFSLAWSACVLNYHSLSIGTNSLGWNRYMASFLSASAELPAQLFVFFGLKYVGGRTSFVIMTSLSGISLLTSLPFLRSNRIVVIVCNIVGKMFASGAFATLYVIIGDFFPTLLRNLSYSSSVPSRMITMLAPFLLFLGDQNSKAIPYAVMGVVAIIAACGTMFLPETRNTSLPDTIEDARRQDDLPRGCFCCRSSTDKHEVEEDAKELQDM